MGCNDRPGDDAVNPVTKPAIGSVQCVLSAENPPVGWLHADGSAFDFRRYPELGPVLGMTTLPDCRPGKGDPPMECIIYAGDPVMSCPNNCPGEDPAAIIFDRKDLPQVEVVGHGIVVKVDWPIMKDRINVDIDCSSGNLRSIALGYLALAEYQYVQEHRLFDVRDLIANDLFERGWITLNIMERDIVRRAQATGRWSTTQEG